MTTLQKRLCRSSGGDVTILIHGAELAGTDVLAAAIACIGKTRLQTCSAWAFTRQHMEVADVVCAKFSTDWSQGDQLAFHSMLKDSVIDLVFLDDLTCSGDARLAFDAAHQTHKVVATMLAESVKAALERLLFYGISAKELNDLSFTWIASYQDDWDQTQVAYDVSDPQHPIPTRATDPPLLPRFSFSPLKKFVSLTEYLQASQALMLKTWHERPSQTHVAVHDHTDLRYRTREFGDTIHPIRPWRRTQAFALVRPTGDTEFWVNINLVEHQYTKAWDDYLRLYHTVSKPQMAGFDLDHMFSKKLAQRRNLQFVRMAPVDSSANRSWGGFVERVLGVGAHSRKRQVLMSYFVAAKFVGLPAPQFGRRTDISLQAELLIQRLVKAKALDQKTASISIRAILSLMLRVKAGAHALRM